MCVYVLLFDIYVRIIPLLTYLLIWGLGKYWNAFHEIKMWEVKKNTWIFSNGCINEFLKIETDYIYTLKP